MFSAPSGDYPWEVVFAPGGRNAVYTTYSGDRSVCCVGPGGERGPLFESVAGLVVSPRGDRYAYAGYEGDTARVYDGVRPGERFELVQGPVLSPDGKRIAYAGRRDDLWRGVVDHHEGEAFDYVGQPRFSPDGRHVAYEAKEGKRAFVVVDDHRGAEFDEVERPLFFPNGHDLAYLARRGKRAYLVRGGREEEVPRGATGLVLGREGRHAYRVRAEGLLSSRTHVHVDGERGPAFDGTRGLTFSGDGSRVAYRARTHRSGGDRWRVVVDGTPGPEFSWVEDPALGPDGRRVAYGVNQGGLVFDDRGSVLIDGGTWSVAVDHVPGRAVECRGLSIPEFDPQGTHWVCKAWRDDKELLLVRDRPDGLFRGVGPPLFAREGGLMAYGVCTGRTFSRRVLKLDTGLPLRAPRKSGR